jgi:hypothetical protein
MAGFKKSVLDMYTGGDQDEIRLAKIIRIHRAFSYIA